MKRLGQSIVSFIDLVLAEQSETFTAPKTFIAVSSVLTWAKTKIENEEADSLTEDEFRRRKAHPNFKAHLALEKEITKFGKKNNLKTYVIAPGLVYHAGESIFHFLLKDAWHNEGALVCYGDGSNVLPTIHLDDLVNILVEIIETNPEPKYLVAVDDSKSSMAEITRAISELLGSGQVNFVDQEEAFFKRGLTQQQYDMITVGLRIDPGHIKEMTLEWKYETGLIENLPQIIQEYKDSRGLWPIKVMIHGPPASRKTFYAEKLAENYKIHLVDVDQVMQEVLERLENKVHAGPSEDGEEDLEADKELLNELKETFKTTGKFSSSQIITFVREKLRSMPCRNQGYVLDGFPSLLEEAQELFKPSDDEQRDEKAFPADELTIPDFIFSFDISDQAIKQRMMKLPESQLAGTRNAEDGKLNSS